MGSGLFGGSSWVQGSLAFRLGQGFLGYLLGRPRRPWVKGSWVSPGSGGLGYLLGLEVWSISWVSGFGVPPGSGLPPGSGGLVYLLGLGYLLGQGVRCTSWVGLPPGSGGGVLVLDHRVGR